MRPANQWLSFHLSPFLVFAFCQHCESKIRRRKGARSRAVGGEREPEARTREIWRGTNQRWAGEVGASSSERQAGNGGGESREGRIRTTTPPGRSMSIDRDRRKGGTARALPEEGRSHAWGRRSRREVRIYAIVPRLAVRILHHRVYRGTGAAQKRGGAVAHELGGKLQKRPFVCPDLSLRIGRCLREDLGAPIQIWVLKLFFLLGHPYLAMSPQIGVMLELL
jgi:hypothetical protein